MRIVDEMCKRHSFRFSEKRCSISCVGRISDDPNSFFVHFLQFSRSTYIDEDGRKGGIDTVEY